MNHPSIKRKDRPTIDTPSPKLTVKLGLLARRGMHLAEWQTCTCPLFCVGTQGLLTRILAKCSVNLVERSRFGWVMIVALESHCARSGRYLLGSVERRTDRALRSISPIMEEPSLCGKLHGLAYLCAPTGNSLADDGTPERPCRPRCGLTGCEGNRPGQSEPVDPMGGWGGSDHLGNGAVCGEAFRQRTTVTERNADNIPTGTQGVSPLRQAARCGARAARVEG